MRNTILIKQKYNLLAGDDLTEYLQFHNWGRLESKLKSVESDKDMAFMKIWRKVEQIYFLICLQISMKFIYEFCILPLKILNGCIFFFFF